MALRGSKQEGSSPSFPLTPPCPSTTGSQVNLTVRQMAKQKLGSQSARRHKARVQGTFAAKRRITLPCLQRTSDEREEAFCKQNKMNFKKK